MVNYLHSLLKEKSIVIYLSASPDTLFNRIKDNTERPLLNGGGMQNKIKKFLLERELKYKEAHHHIDTEDKEPSEIVRELCPDLYKEIWNEEIDRWIEEQIHELDMYDPDDGDTLDMYIDFPEEKDNLKTIVWREDNE